MKKTLIIAAALPVLAACSDSGANYKPILDGAPSAAYQADLAACQSLARSQNQFDQERVAATIFGAGAGAVLGEADSGDALGGAVAGALAGGVASSVMCRTAANPLSLNACAVVATAWLDRRYIMSDPLTLRARRFHALHDLLTGRRRDDQRAPAAPLSEDAGLRAIDASQSIVGPFGTLIRGASRWGA